MSDTAKKLIACMCVCAMLAALCACGRQVVTGTGTGTSDNTASDTGSTAAAAGDGKFSLFYESGYSLNPMKTTNSDNQLVCSLIYENMVTVDNSFNLQAGMIIKWASDDGIHWTFDTDTTHVFSDGSKVTARDVAYSLRCAINNARYENRFNGWIAAISADDDDTFSVTLNKENTQFPMLLTLPVIEYNTMQNTYPVGSGAYTWAEDHKSLTANTHYAGAKALPVSAVYLQTYGAMEDFITKFEDSTCDLVINDPSTSADLGFGSANEVRSFNTTNLHFIAFNMEKSYFKDGRLQYAFSRAFDRKYMAETLMQGNALPACEPINPASPLYNKYFDQRLGYDMDACRKTLAKIGVDDYDSDGSAEYKMGENNVELNLSFLVCTESSAKVSLAEKFASEMADIGITVNVKKLGWEDYKAALTAGSFDMCYCEVRLSPDFDLSCILDSGGAANYSRGYDKTAVKYISQYLSASDKDRQDYCDQLCNYIAETGLIIPICFEKHQIITHKGVITDMTVNQNDPMYNFADWKIKVS